MPRRQSKDVILALDLSSSSTGFAVLRKGRWNKSGASYGLIKISPKLSLAERLVKLRDELTKLIKTVKPTFIVIEDVFKGRNIKTMKLLARFNGVAIELSRRLIKKDPMVVLAAEVRSYLECGRKKEEAFEYVCNRYNLDWKFSKMNDVADAVCLALYAHGKLKEKDEK